MVAQTTTGELDRETVKKAPKKKRIPKPKPKTKPMTADVPVAPKAKSKSKAKPKTKKPTKAQLKQKAEMAQGAAALRREAVGLGMLLFALIALLSVLSYSPGDVTNPEPTNLIGPVGVYVGGALLSVFGIGAFFFNALLWFIGFSFVVGRPIQWRPSDVAGRILFVLSGATLCHLAFSAYRVLGHDAGGWVGAFSGEFGRSVVGTVGTSIIFGGLLLLSLMLVTQLSLNTLTRQGLTQIHKWTAYAKHRWSVHQMYRERLAEERAKMITVGNGRVSVDVEAKSEAALSAEPLVNGRSYGFEENLENDVSSKLAKKLKRLGKRSKKGEPKEEIPEAVELDAVRKKITDEIERDSEWKMDAPVPINGVLNEPDVVADTHHDFVDIPKEKAPVKAGPVVDFGPQIVESDPATKDKSAMLEKANFSPKQKGMYSLPSISFLDYEATNNYQVDRDELRQMAARIEQCLLDFKVEGTVVEICPGPVITMFEFSPAPGVRVSKIANLSDDLAMALAAFSVRIVAPIPGKSVVGIEVPNPEREMVFLKEIVADDVFVDNTKMDLPLALGCDVEGRAIVADLARMPHLLVAGATGSGKSVAVNTMIISLLYRHTPEDVRFIMVDPKMLEFSVYEDIPHLLLPVVTDPKQATVALNWAVMEMERRYQKLADMGVRNIKGYNAKVAKLTKQAELDMLNGLSASAAMKTIGMDHDNVTPDHFHLPYIVVIIDEFADLMMTAAKEVETAVARLAQKARAAGLHLILATQRPSTDVITGLIKANFPTRVALRVTSKTDSRVILDNNGAENLLGNGDMLFVPPGSSALQRVHGAYVSEDEIERIVDFLKTQGEAQYDVSILEVEDESKKALLEEDRDEHYEAAVRLVIESEQASISMIQRKLRVGYNRAARMVEMMEAEGFVSPAFGCKPREVLIDHAPF